MANPDQCAVNPDSTLKDASEITFYDSEGNDQPIPMHSGNNLTSSQDQTSRAARGAKSQQDNLAASGAVPACKVTGTCQHKLTWTLTTNKNVANTASTSTGSQKWTHPEQKSPVKGGGYGDAMMCKAVNVRREREKCGRNPHQELQDYLDSPLEDVVDRVKWWG
ncbi:hypothetical protein BDN67DRAFT_985378, partial [Paxillus ammoniavirescens]